MKRALSKMAFFLIILFGLALLVIVPIRHQEQEFQLASLRTAMDAVISMQATALEDGYFSWTELQDSIIEHQMSVAGELLKPVYEAYPFVQNISIQPGVPPLESFNIDGLNQSIYLTYSIKDDFGYNALPAWKAVVILDAQKVINSIHPAGNLVIDPLHGKPLIHDIKVRFTTPFFTLIDYLVAIFASIALGYPLWMYLKKRTVYFYETKGLESIIFLFEQTEKSSANHSRRVAALTLFIGKKLGFRGAKLRNLYTAALLHDIGKISIPSDILTKNGPLTHEEIQSIKKHPLISARILKNFKELSHLEKIVLYHHERMDGSGYPEGLKGKEIPFDSRIIAVLDVFEALIGDRPYREPSDVFSAFETLRSMPLDQEVVEVLARYYHEFSNFQSPKWAVAFDPISFV